MLLPNQVHEAEIQPDTSPDPPKTTSKQATSGLQPPVRAAAVASSSDGLPLRRSAELVRPGHSIALKQVFIQDFVASRRELTRAALVAVLLLVAVLALLLVLMIPASSR